MKTSIKILLVTLVSVLGFSFSRESNHIIKDDTVLLVVRGYISSYDEETGCWTAFSCYDNQYYTFEDPDNKIESGYDIYDFHFVGSGSPCFRKLTLMDNEAMGSCGD